MKILVSLAVWLGILAVIFGCVSSENPASSLPSSPATTPPLSSEPLNNYPKIASWLAKKDEIISSRKQFDLVMSAWFTPEEAAQIIANNPSAVLLAGLTVNWVLDNRDWKSFLLTVASYGREVPFAITEDMYLRGYDGQRCAFGWASEEWGHEEIFAMDPRNPEWVELITSFYKVILEQPHHDGIIVDMVIEKSWCPEAMSDEEWIESITDIFTRIRELNVTNKPVIFNSGRDFSEIDEFAEFMDGYVMENFMGEQLKTTFDEGLEAAEKGLIVIYAADTDNTGEKDLNRMRLGLVLSMLHDNTYFAYDFGFRDHGQAWWFSEYDAEPGKPLGDYYREGDAYYREFENGTVVASPFTNVSVSFNQEYTDITTGRKSTTFQIEKGDGRIYVKDSHLP